MHEQTSSRLSLPCQREESGHKTSPVYSAEQSMTPLSLDFEIAKEACKFRPAQFRPPQAGSSTRSSTHSFEWGCLGAFWGPGFVGHRFQVGLHSAGVSFHILTLAWAHGEPHVLSFLLVGQD